MTEQLDLLKTIAEHAEAQLKAWETMLLESAPEWAARARESQSDLAELRVAERVLLMYADLDEGRSEEQVMVKRKPLGPHKDAAERIGLIVFSNQDYIDDTGHITEKIDEIEKLLMDKFEAKE